jgi:hypothetical protein
MDCVAQILDFYNRKIDDKQAPLNYKLYLSNLLIKIMKNFSEGKTNDFELQNCLILLINLFSDHDSPDHYNNKGKNANDIADEEKSLFKEILKREFINS